MQNHFSLKKVKIHNTTKGIVSDSSAQGQMMLMRFVSDITIEMLPASVSDHITVSPCG